MNIETAACSLVSKDNVLPAVRVRRGVDGHGSRNCHKRCVEVVNVQRESRVRWGPLWLFVHAGWERVRAEGAPGNFPLVSLLGAEVLLWQDFRYERGLADTRTK